MRTTPSGASQGVHSATALSFAMRRRGEASGVSCVLGTQALSCGGGAMGVSSTRARKTVLSSTCVSGQLEFTYALRNTWMSCFWSTLSPLKKKVGLVCESLCSSNHCPLARAAMSI